MPRLLVALLLLALAGCSGTAVTTSPTPDSRGKGGTGARRHDTGPRDSAVSPPADTRRGDTHPARDPERLKALVADLRGNDEARRAEAAKELRGWGKGAAAAEAALCRAAAHSADPDTRQAALEALQAADPDAFPDLSAVLTDADPKKRVAAEKHLATLAGTPGQAARFAPLVVGRLGALPAEAQKADAADGAGEEFSALWPLLRKAGPPGADAVDVVAACAKANPYARALWEPAQLALCEIAKQDKERREQALAALDSSISQGRTSLASLRAVGDLGPDAKSLAGLLKALAADRREEVRRAAVEALKKVEP